MSSKPSIPLPLVLEPQPIPTINEPALITHLQRYPSRHKYLTSMVLTEFLTSESGLAGRVYASLVHSSQSLVYSCAVLGRDNSTILDAHAILGPHARPAVQELKRIGNPEGALRYYHVVPHESRSSVLQAFANQRGGSKIVFYGRLSGVAWLELENQLKVNPAAAGPGSYSDAEGYSRIDYYPQLD